MLTYIQRSRFEFFRSKCICNLDQLCASHIVFLVKIYKNRQKHENLYCAVLGCKSFNMIWNVLNITQTPTTYTTTAQWTIYGRRKIIAYCFGAHILQSKHTIRLTNFLSFLLRLDILNSVWHRKIATKFSS